jgi:hypothetical protein
MERVKGKERKLVGRARRPKLGTHPYPLLCLRRGEQNRQVEGKTGVCTMSESWEAYGRAVQIKNVPVYTGPGTREYSSEVSRITMVASEGT